MYTIRIEVAFEAGHRLLHYSGMCASPHGHSYKAEVFAKSYALDDLGMGIDFGHLRARCKDWIEANWDHAFLLNDRDSDLADALGGVSEARLYLFPDQNPTAEAMARTLFELTRGFGWDIESVRIWESPNQFAEYARDEGHAARRR